MEGTKRLPFGLRNYLATTTIDVLSPTRSRVTCSGRFDLPADVPRDTVKDFIDNVYGSIIYGIEDLILSLHCIGSASCRERVCPYFEIWVVGVLINKETK